MQGNSHFISDNVGLEPIHQTNSVQSTIFQHFIIYCNFRRLTINQYNVNQDLLNLFNPPFLCIILQDCSFSMVGGLISQLYRSKYNGLKYVSLWYSAAPPGLRFGGNTLGGRPHGGSGGGAPRTPEIFENFQKICKENSKKCIILAHFSKQFNKQCVTFRKFGGKTRKTKF